MAIVGNTQASINLVWSDFKHSNSRLLAAIGCWGAALAETRFNVPKHAPGDNERALVYQAAGVTRLGSEGGAAAKLAYGLSGGGLFRLCLLPVALRRRVVARACPVRDVL